MNLPKHDAYENMEVNNDYKEILELVRMLVKEKIKFDGRRLFDGWQIEYPSHENRVCSVIEHFGSYGNEEDKLEIMGLLTEDEEEQDSVLGFLSADEVFERIYNHWRESAKNET